MKNGTNITQLAGNVGRDDGELGELPGGTPVLNFSLAVNSGCRNKTSGEFKPVTEWFKVAIYGERARRLAPEIIGGTAVRLEGRLHAAGWVGEDGKARVDVTLRVNQFNYVVIYDKNPRSGGDGAGSEAVRSPADDFDDYYQPE